MVEVIFSSPAVQGNNGRAQRQEQAHPYQSMFKEKTMNEESITPTTAPNPEKVALNKRLETIGWGAFLILLGGFALVPGDTLSKGWWSIGIGIILLGLNGARYMNGIRMSGFTTIIGVLSLLGGVVQLAGWKSMDGAFFLIILGAYLLLKPVFERRGLFGKAEQS
jgi:hypothetical protein